MRARGLLVFTVILHLLRFLVEAKDLLELLMLLQTVRACWRQVVEYIVAEGVHRMSWTLQLIVLMVQLNSGRGR